MVYDYKGEDTIAAVATGEVQSAISVIRISGKQALPMLARIFKPAKKQASVLEFEANTIHFGRVYDGDMVLDEVLVSIFKAPHSFTGEDSVEISCHGSSYIRAGIMRLLVREGARVAQAGEFTQRAFMHGKMDLSQAEAVADLIASETAMAHRVAMHQLKGGFAQELRVLRAQLLDFASLVELELDFAEEDVEFANRSQLTQQVNDTRVAMKRLLQSFSFGNVLKTGVPVAIVGKPNVGKSTLLNALLGEEKAIVSAIAGTTRDVIEDTLVLEGIPFRMIDTAGIRENPDNEIESIGIQRTYEKLKGAHVILYVAEADEFGDGTVVGEGPVTGSAQAVEIQAMHPEAHVILVLNKADLRHEILNWNGFTPMVSISAKEGEGLDSLRKMMVTQVQQSARQEGTIVTNMRHYEALQQADHYLAMVLKGLQEGLPGDLVAMDIRQALHHLGAITGEISTDDLLGNIFGRFCIGK